MKSPAPALAGGLGALALVLAVGLEKVRESGAVPVDECGPAPALYGSVPWLFALGLVLVAFSVARLVRDAGRAAKFAALGLLIAAGGPLAPPLLLPGVGLFVLAIAVRALAREGQAPGYAVSPLRPGAVLIALAAVTALATAATLLLGLADSAIHTATFVPRLVTLEEVARFRWSLFGLSFFFGLEVGPLVVGGILAVALVHRGLTHLFRPRPAAEALLFSLLLGLATFAAIVIVFRLTLADELDEIGIAGEFALLAALGGMALGLHAHANLVRAGRPRRVESVFVHAGNLLLLGLVPPSERVAASPVRRTGAALLAGVAAAIVLSLALYPTVEDFRGEVFDSYAWLVILLSTLTLFALAPRRYAGGVAVALLTAQATLAAAIGAGEASGRLVANEYSRIGSLAAFSIPARILDPFDRIGVTPWSGVRYVHHAPGEGEEWLPPLPRRLAARIGRPPVVVVLWDAARPDHLSAYGYGRRTTPCLDRIAAESAVFTRAYATATATTASVRHLMTGRYCTRFMLATDHPPFLTGELARAGYDRFVITVTGTDYNGVSAEAFRRGWGSDREGLRFVAVESPNEDLIKPDAEKTDLVISALRRIHERRGSLTGTFVYVHVTGTHTPWLNENAVADFGDRPEDLYDGEIAKADRLLGRLLGALEDLGEGDRAVIVVTADHGTGLREHGRYAGFLPYEEQIRVPLVIRVPGLEPSKIADRVALIDVAPTVVGLVSPGLEHRFHGRSLLPLMTGKRTSLPPRPLVCFNSFRDSYAIFGPEGSAKLHHDRGRHYEGLFDLAEDPGETRNLVADEPETARRLRDLLSAFLWQGRRDYANPYHYRDWTGPK